MNLFPNVRWNLALLLLLFAGLIKHFLLTSKASTSAWGCKSDLSFVWLIETIFKKKKPKVLESEKVEKKQEIKLQLAILL